MSVEPRSSFSSTSFLWSQREEESELCAINGDWWLHDPVENSECTTVENFDDDDNAGSLAKKLKSYVDSDESTELKEDYLFKTAQTSLNVSACARVCYVSRPRFVSTFRDRVFHSPFSFLVSSIFICGKVFSTV
ncbi:hypothetical protein PUN28_019427 [Cardiocondyla obscurior]|uniref:Uncharacterized protein n=1 Tax=Cardiocondyla obscurior TaxID=286306 RepID=A0AAW2EFA5_9HYME